MRIKELCPDERPREKMRLRGAKALSNADLLAILLGSGTGGRSVIDVAQELMVSAGGRLSLLGVMPLEKLVSHKGVGEARAITIAAALELGRRALEEQVLVDKRAITSPEMVYQLMLPQLKNLDHEECWVLYLNRSNFLIGREMISSATPPGFSGRPSRNKVPISFLYTTTRRAPPSPGRQTFTRRMCFGGPSPSWKSAWRTTWLLPKTPSIPSAKSG